MVDPSLSAQENARRMLDEHYGKGNWPNKNNRREKSQIEKYINRHILKGHLVPDGIPDNGIFYTNEFGYKIYEVYYPERITFPDGYYFDTDYRIYAVIDGEYFQIYE